MPRPVGMVESVYNSPRHLSRSVLVDNEAPGVPEDAPRRLARVLEHRV